MKCFYKYFISAIFCLSIMESCVMTSVVDNINDVVNDKITGKSKSEELKEGYLSVKISNIASNTSLQIDSMEVCNILIKDETNGMATRGNVKLNNTTVKLLVQELLPWIPNVLPENSTGMYVKIYGKMYTFLADNKPFELCSSPMYFTFNGSVLEGRTTDVEFVVYDNCPLYCEVGGKMLKVLKSISFDVSVEDWVE